MSLYGNPYNPYGFPAPFGGQFNSPGGPQGTQQALFGQPTMSQPTTAPRAYDSIMRRLRDL